MAHDRFEKVLSDENDTPSPPRPQTTLPIVVQKWEESERGWGVRPDGWTMHVNMTARDTYVKEFWAREKASNPSGETPDEYTRTSGSPYLMDVDEETYEKVKVSKNGMWGEGNMPPSGKQGQDGFISGRPK